jgi:tRNA(Ile)-lysidine synthase
MFGAMIDAVVERVHRTVGASRPANPALLAVSGGIDSMVLLDAALAAWPAGSFRVATFDHATGPHAATAVDLVETVALGRGVSVIVGRAAPAVPQTEASWRESRLSFLRAAAVEYRATLFTAHTQDDQAETVLFRELRGAGTRGLAGLRASSDIGRPLLAFNRAEIERYAHATDLRWVDDPSNASRAFARNRIRIDLLPALRRQTPDIDDVLVNIGERAAQWRRDVDDTVNRLIDFDADGVERELDVSIESLRPYGAETLAIVWPALLARIGIAADRRGTRRLVEFTTNGSTSQRIQLSGGWVVFRRRKTLEVRWHGATDR